MTENDSNFLKELEALTRKYKVAIGGCGCCGSPWLNDLPEKKLTPSYGYYYDDKLLWDNPVSEENLEKQRFREEAESKRKIQPESDLELYAKYGNKPLKDENEYV